LILAPARSGIQCNATQWTAICLAELGNWKLLDKAQWPLIGGSSGLCGWYRVMVSADCFWPSASGEWDLRPHWQTQWHVYSTAEIVRVGRRLSRPDEGMLVRSKLCPTVDALSDCQLWERQGACALTWREHHAAENSAVGLLSNAFYM
jgi:hypothetical protein